MLISRVPFLPHPPSLGRHVMKTETPPKDETPCPIKNGVKRPDVAARHSRRKTLVEQCVKCALSGRLAPAWDPRLRAVLMDNLERQVRSTSEITVRGSLLVNEVLLHCLRTELPLPPLTQAFFNACFLQGLKKSSRKSKSDFTVVKDVHDNEFYDYPAIQRTRGDCQAITIAAARYGTNLKTSVLHAFLGRQKSFLRTWLRYHEVESEEVSAYRVQCLINGWEKPPRKCKRKRRKDEEDYPEEEIPAEVLAFIKQEQTLLGNPNDFGITDKTCVESLLRYLFHILEFYREHGVGRGFSIAPVCQVKRHFMTVDTTVLFELLKNVATEAGPNLCPDWLTALGNMSLPTFFQEQHQGLRNAAWNVTFHIDGLRRRRTFGHQIDTDGVAMTVHFHVTIRKRARHQRRTQRQPDKYKRIVAIDPGRTNLVAALDSSTSKVHTLTRGEYYKKARIVRLQQKIRTWELPLRGVVSALAETSIRTSSASLAYAYRQVLGRNYDRLWRLRFEKKRAREALACYAGKQHVLDSFFSSFTQRGEEKPIVAYGAASLKPGGKGEVNVPVKGVLKVCRKHYRTVLVNEYLTTKVHHACRHRLNPIASQKAGAPSRAIRGLCWCQTCTKFVSRDGNAAHNILRVFKSNVYKGGTRPHDMRFGQPHQKTQTLLKLP